jgi:hypothetical protein
MADSSEALNEDRLAKAYSNLRDAIMEEKKVVQLYRRDFFDICIQTVDSLRTRVQPEPQGFAKKIVEDCGRMVPVRNHIIDWVLLESEVAPTGRFTEALLEFMERLRALKLRPSEVTAWNESWFEAHKLFVYEIFLYVVAALLKTKAYECVHELFWGRFIQGPEEPTGLSPFVRFDDFYAHSELINSVLAPPNQRLFSPAAELISKQAHRKDIGFPDLIEADLLALLIAFVDPEVRWYPQLMLYAQRVRRFPLFVRASVHKDFMNLAKITGIDDVNTLKAKVNEGQNRLNVANWNAFVFDRSFAEALNLERLDTLK